MFIPEGKSPPRPPPPPRTSPYGGPGPSSGAWGGQQSNFNRPPGPAAYGGQAQGFGNQNDYGNQSGAAAGFSNQGQFGNRPPPPRGGGGPGFNQGPGPSAGGPFGGPRPPGPQGFGQQQDFGGQQGAYGPYGYDTQIDNTGGEWAIGPNGFPLNVEAAKKRNPCKCFVCFGCCPLRKWCRAMSAVGLVVYFPAIVLAVLFGLQVSGSGVPGFVMAITSSFMDASYFNIGRSRHLNGQLFEDGSTMASTNPSTDGSMSTDSSSPSSSMSTDSSSSMSTDSSSSMSIDSSSSSIAPSSPTTKPASSTTSTSTNPPTTGTMSNVMDKIKRQIAWSFILYGMLACIMWVAHLGLMFAALKLIACCCLIHTILLSLTIIGQLAGFVVLAFAQNQVVGITLPIWFVHLPIEIFVSICSLSLRCQIQEGIAPAPVKALKPGEPGYAEYDQQYNRPMEQDQGYPMQQQNQGQQGPFPNNPQQQQQQQPNQPHLQQQNQQPFQQQQNQQQQQQQPLQPQQQQSPLQRAQSQMVIKVQNEAGPSGQQQPKATNPYSYPPPQFPGAGGGYQQANPGLTAQEVFLLSQLNKGRRKTRGNESESSESSRHGRRKRGRRKGHKSHSRKKKKKKSKGRRGRSKHKKHHK